MFSVAYIYQLFSSVQGFSVGLDRVKHLPCCETETFEVRFDPQSANLPLGEVNVLLPIKVLQLWGQAAGWAQQQMPPGLSTGCSVLH